MSLKPKQIGRRVLKGLLLEIGPIYYIKTAGLAAADRPKSPPAAV
jgi:hypothetical protein